MSHATNSYTEALKVWVIEYDHGPHAHGVHGIASTLKEAFEKVRAATSVQWDEPAQAVMGGAWLIRGTWHDGFREGPQFVLYRVTEHSVPSGPNDGLERAVVDAAMTRLAKWREKYTEANINLPAGSAARKLIEACIALEQSRLFATTGGHK